jgi:hypothetical protein
LDRRQLDRRDDFDRDRRGQLDSDDDFDWRSNGDRQDRLTQMGDSTRAFDVPLNRRRTDSAKAV